MTFGFANTMKRTYSGVDDKRLAPDRSFFIGASVDDKDGSNDKGGLDTDKEGEYWVTTRVGDAESHKFFLRVKILFGNNEDSVFYKHIDAALSIKEIKDMIKRKKMPKDAVDHPMNLRVQMQGMCKMVGAGIRDVQNGDGTPTVDAEEKYKQDDKTLKQALAECEHNQFLLGHELVDKNAKTMVVLHWGMTR